MKNIKIWKIVVIACCTPVVITAVTLLSIKFAWRIVPGFGLCEDAEDSGTFWVQSITDDEVECFTLIAGLGYFFDGYKYEVKDNTLYVGIKYIPLLGSYGQGGWFTVPVNERIDKVILCGKGNERVIYDKSVDPSLPAGDKISKPSNNQYTSSQYTSSVN